MVRQILPLVTTLDELLRAKKVFEIATNNFKKKGPTSPVDPYLLKLLHLAATLHKLSALSLKHSAYS